MTNMGFWVIHRFLLSMHSLSVGKEREERSEGSWWVRECQMWNQGDPEITELLAEQQLSWASFQSSLVDLGLEKGRRKQGNKIMPCISEDSRLSHFFKN